MNELLLALVFFLYGIFAACIAGKDKTFRVLAILPVILIGLYLVNAVGIVSSDDFRALFPPTFQFWGSILVGQAMLASSFIAIGWILVEAFKQKKRDYIFLCAILIFGVPAVYLKTFAIDYSALSEAPAKNDFIRQSTDYTCSAASVVNLCYLYNEELSEQEVARIMRLNKFGGSVHQIAHALKKLEFTFSETKNQTIEQLTLPAILVVDYGPLKDGHAILVKAQNGDRFQVIDPLSGIVEIRAANWFTHNWGGSGVENISKK